MMILESHKLPSSSAPEIHVLHTELLGMTQKKSFLGAAPAIAAMFLTHSLFTHMCWLSAEEEEEAALPYFLPLSKLFAFRFEPESVIYEIPPLSRFPQKEDSYEKKKKKKKYQFEQKSRL